MRYDDTEEPAKLGDIEFQWKDGGTPAVKFNMLAHSGRGELLMVSMVADGGRIKQIRAALCGSEKSRATVRITASGIKTKQASAEDWQAAAPWRLTPSPDGYQMYQHKLGYGMSHALFVTRTQGFMMVVTPESLWQELNGVRFTTPLLREWMPYVERELRACNRLEDAHVFHCKCGLLTAATAKLDEIVVDGLSHHKIHITREEDAVLAAA